jgi:hypothetical protein
LCQIFYQTLLYGVGERAATRPKQKPRPFAGALSDRPSSQVTVTSIFLVRAASLLGSLISRTPWV